MNVEDFVEESKIGRTQFDYKQILLIHLRNISRLTTTVIFPSSQEPYAPEQMVQILTNMLHERFVEAVHFFRMLLSPYFDKKYHEDIDKLLKEQLSDNTFAMHLSGILIELMDRRNLLLESERGVKV